jgi:hypothetical protein
MALLMGEINRYYELCLYKRNSHKADRIKCDTENDVNLIKTELKKGYVYCETFAHITMDENKSQGYKNKPPKIVKFRFKLESEGLLQGWKDER